MASSKKGSASNIFVWIILVLLIIGLAGFGVTNFGGSTQAVASVGDTEIDVNTYARELQGELRAIEAQAGQSIPLSSALAFGIDQAVIARLLSSAALDHENTRLGVSVGDVQVAETLRNIPAFQGLDGQFDREAYRFTLQQSGQNETQFEDRLRADAARTLLQGAVYGGLVAPEALVTTILNFVGETRDLTWVKLGPADLDGEAATPSDADLTTYYDANEPAFTAPETKKLTYAWVSPSMLLDSIQANEDDLKTLFAERADEYQRPERRLVERLVFADQAAAEDAMARFNANDVSFEDLVSERGLELVDVDLGDVVPADLNGDTATALFDLLVPGVVGPLPSSLGPALFRMNGILAAQETSFEEARPQLLEEYAADKARRQIAANASSVDDLLAGGATLEELSDETDMVFGQIDWTVASADDIAAYQTFRDAAFAVTADDFPEVIEMDDGGIFALRLDEIVPPTLQPFDDVRGAVSAAWAQQDTENRLLEKAETLKAEVETGATLINLGVAVQTQGELRRDSFVENTPEDFMVQAFDMEAGDMKVLQAYNSAYLLRLDAITAPDLTAEDSVALGEALEAQLAQNLAQDVLEAFVTAIQNDAGISVNQATVNAVHAQFP